MKIEPNLCRLAAVIAACMIGSVAHAQQQDTTDSQGQDTEPAAQQEELQGIEPVVPVAPPVVPVEQTGPPVVPPTGPPVVPVEQTGPAVVPVAPVEGFEGVETVTLQTERGPVVVISYPGTVPASEYNIDFSALDADGDGYISRTEASAMAGRSGAAHNLNLEFEVADKNGDGKLAFTEIIEWVY